MQLFSENATIPGFFAHDKLKYDPQKMLRKTKFSTTQTEEFMFQNVAYRLTVYEMG